jgi:hypothetical protein
MDKTTLSVVLLLLTAGCRDSSGDDLILLQNNTRHVGTLQRCLNGGCEFSGGTIPQGTIAWIGLHQARADPPKPNDPAAGEIRLTDLSVHPGLMTAMDPTRVSAAQDSYDRQKVAWVYLGHPEKAASASDKDATTSPSDGCRHAIYHYDVHVAGYRRAAQTVNPGFAFRGPLSETYGWSAQWWNVSLSVKQCNSTLQIRMPAVDGPDQHPAIGQMHIKWDYDDSVEEPHHQPPCRFYKEVWFAGNMWLTSDGFASQDSSHVSFDFDTQPHSAPYLASIAQDCPGSNGFSRELKSANFGIENSERRKNPRESQAVTMKTTHGFESFMGAFNIGLTKQDLPYSPLPFPVDALVAGKGFSLDNNSDPISILHSRQNTSQVMHRMEITFSPAGRFRPPDFSNWWNDLANEWLKLLEHG